jgi:UDP-glucose 4-epimerase
MVLDKPSDSSNDYIVVTGSSGLLGNQIVETLRENNRIICLDLHSNRINEDSLISINADLTEKGSWNQLEKYPIKAIVHCAALIPKNAQDNSEHIYSINRSIDENAIALAKIKNAKLIFISTTGLYGFMKGNMMTEKADLKYDNPYFKGKYETEQNIRLNIDSHYIFRISAPYGNILKHRTVLKIFVEKALSGEVLQYYGSGSRTQQFIHIEDIARACSLALKSKAYGTYNITNETPISMKELAYLIKRATGSSSEIISSETEDSQEDYRSNISITKAKESLGWEPRHNLSQDIITISNCMKNETRNTL